MSTQDIYNYIKVDDRTVTAGQPTEDQLRSASAEGFVTVINLGLLDPRYALGDEAGFVQSCGMAYHHIPVDWENPSEADFAAFERVMGALPEGKTLIHCAANFRVTAFYSLYAQKHLGWSEERSDAFRARMWQGRDNPAWDRFVASIKARLAR